MIERSPWWKLSAEETASVLESHLKTGLNAEGAKARLAQHGPNQLPEAGKISPLKIFIRQFNNFIVWVLVGAAAVAGFLGEWVDTAAILVIVVLNAIFGFVQEYHAERSLAALRKLSSPNSRVMRGGHLELIPSREVVPGDLVYIEAGDKIPADGRITRAVQLRHEEAALTGESVPVNKSSETLLEEDVVLGDRKNMAFTGTAVVSGKGEMLVTSTGLGTELGKIALLLTSTTDEETPLQRTLEKLGQRLVLIFLAVVGLVFIIGLLRGNPWIEMLLTALSLAVAAIPEGLPAVVTVALAIGVRKMAKRHALIRHLPSVETLGSATVICSDKTGTLTQNEMTVRHIWTNGRLIDVTGAGYAPEGKFLEGGKDVDPGQDPALLETLRIGALCNGAELEEAGAFWRVLGDPTEGALLTLAKKAGIEKADLEFEDPLLSEAPFDSDRKRMSILRKTPKGPVLFVKGAPDVILGLSSKVLAGGQVLRLDSAQRREIEITNHQFGARALRVLAMAYREVPEGGEASPVLEKELIFAGLVAMMDPPRPEAKRAIEICRKAGVRPVMITGDHKETAVAVARELGLLGPHSIALNGSELDALSEKELEEAVHRVSVFARVSAEHKLKIVRAWKKRNAVVAMTGDGVNDAPAIKEADIGVAMGIAGTDVTKEASDMVVTDDNFASIVNAVEEGRGIYDNIVKFVKFLLAFNIAEVLVIFMAILVGFVDKAGHAFVPLSAVQILWMNLVTDGFPAIALGVDPLDPHAMSRAPRGRDQSIFTRRFILELCFISVLVASGALLACFVGLKTDVMTAQTMTLTALVVLELAGAHMVRWHYHLRFFSNKWLTGALALSFALQLLILYVPALQKVFQTVPLDIVQWGVIVSITAAVVIIAWTVHRIFKNL